MTSNPAVSYVPTTYPIKEISCLTPDVCTLKFDMSMNAKPGQFVMCWLPGYDETPFSVAGDDGKELMITYFKVGDFTNKLATKKVGDLVGLRGPFGKPYTWKQHEHIVVVGGGYGAAPMFFLTQELERSGATTEVILGARTKANLIYLPAFNQLVRKNLHIATDDGSQGRQGLTTELLEELLEEAKNDPSYRIDQIFSCGPEPMLVAVSNVAAKYNVPAQISWTRYMKSGYGAAGTCVLDPIGIRLSVEGPVLTNDISQQITEFGEYRRDAKGMKEYFS